MNTGKKIFWGILFLVAAVAVIAGGMGYLEGFNFWTIVLTIGAIGGLVEGIFHRNFGSILFAIAVLAIVYDDVLGIEAITPWPVLGAAMLGTIGLNILFPDLKKKNSFHHHGFHNGEFQQGVGTENLDGENVHFEVCFGEAVKYLASQELSQVDLECSFGSLNVFFNNALLKNGVANVHAECSFGSMVLYVPSNWNVVLNVSNAFGGVDEKGRCNPDGTNTLYINGEVSFGSMEIRYI